MKRRTIIVDTETSTFAKGNPFSRQNKLWLVGVYEDEKYTPYQIEWEEHALYGPACSACLDVLGVGSLLCGFNIKFDLHWLRRYGIFPSCVVWDCQLAHYILRRQQARLPSMNEVAEYYGLPGKLEYDWESHDWDKLVEYNEQDCKLTHQIYLRQRAEFSQRPNLFKLFRVCCEDLLVLEEMEWNGLKYDFEYSKLEAERLATEVSKLDREMCDLVGCSDVNWSSPNHVSAVVYGGILTSKFREQYIFTYRNGQTKEKERWSTRETKLPGFVTPSARDAKDKEGVYATDEQTLIKIRDRARGGKLKQLINMILERKKLEKLRTTYYEGWPKLYNSMEWDDGCIHGNLQQSITVSGRLASSKPNQQNAPKIFRKCITSRFERVAEEVRE